MDMLIVHLWLHLCWVMAAGEGVYVRDIVIQFFVVLAAIRHQHEYIQCNYSLCKPG